MQSHEFNTGVIRPIECVREGWELIKDEYWTLFVVSIVGALIAGFTMYVLLGAMICGIFGCYLNKIDGGRVNFDDLWKGFAYLGPSAVVTILFVIPIVVYVVAVFVTIYSPLVIAAVMGNKADPTVILGAFLGAIAIDIVIAVLMTCAHSLLVFSFPLIVDRKLTNLDAVKVSARAAMKNIGGIAGLVGVNFVLVLIGQLALCIGVYFVIPIITATNLVAYRKVFPRLGHGAV